MAQTRTTRPRRGTASQKPRRPLLKQKSGGFLANLALPLWLRQVGGYFAGSWREVKQVRWPNRNATWSLTAAVLVFTAFWAAIILSVDMLSQLFLNKLILKQ